MNVYKGRLLKKSSNRKSTLVLSNIAIVTDVAANFGCDRFRITPYIVSKLLRAAICSRCAVRFESEQTPFPLAGSRFRPAAFSALHRIRFGTWGLFLCHIFTQRPMTDRKIERSNGRGFGRQQLFSLSTSRQFHRNFQFS